MPYLNIRPKITTSTLCFGDKWFVRLIVMCPDRIPQGTPAPLLVSATWSPARADGPVTLNLISQSEAGGRLSFDAAGEVSTHTLLGDDRQLLELHAQAASAGTDDVVLQIQINEKEQERLPLSVGSVSSALALHGAQVGDPAPPLVFIGGEARFTAAVTPATTGTFQWESVDPGLLAVRAGGTEARVAVEAVGAVDAARPLCVLFTPETGPALMHVHPLAGWPVTDPADAGPFAVGALDYGRHAQHNRIHVFDPRTGVPALDRAWGEAGTGAAQFARPSGLALASDGKVYVADRDNHRVQVFTADGVALRAWGEAGTGNGQFDHPAAVALDGSGNVFVADEDNHRIQVFDADGAFVRAWGHQGTEDGEFDAPAGIALASDGKVYVADRDNHRIQVFNSDGTFRRTWGSEGTADGELDAPTGLTVDTAGLVYVCDTGNHRIQVFNADGVLQHKWGTEGTADGELDAPAGIAVDSADRVFVADRDNHRIQVFTATGTFLRTWGESGTALGQFNSPTGLALDSADRVYIADRGNHRIQRSALRVWGATGNANGQFSTPAGVAVDGGGQVFVTDQANDRLQLFSAEGVFVRTWGTTGTGDGEFVHPAGVAVDGGGQVFVTDRDNHRVQVFDGTGAFVRTWGASGTGNGQFDHPTGLAVDGGGLVYVCDTDNHRLQVFNATGAFQRTWGSQGAADGEFDAPTGIALDSAGLVYVADRDNHRLQVFTATGTFLRKWGSPGTGDGQFDAPAALALDAADRVYVADRDNHRLQVFTATGTLIRAWGAAGAGTGQFDAPAGVAVGASGQVFVADTGHDRLQRFTPEVTRPGFARTWGTFGEGNGEFQEPAGLAVSPEGQVYVADQGHDRLQQFDANGGFVRTWGILDGSDGNFFRPGSVAVDGAGNVYVTDRDNHRVQVFDASGSFLRKWGTQGSATGEFERPNGIAVSAGGDVYVADEGNHRIQHFDATGTFQNEWGSRGAADGAFDHPIGVALDGAGNVYVTDRDNHRVQVFDASGSFLRRWGSFGQANGAFRRPHGIAVHGSDVYVTDVENHRVQQFDTAGAFQQAWGRMDGTPGHFGAPVDVAVDAAGLVYVTDARPYFLIPAFQNILGESFLEDINVTLDVVLRYPADVAGTGVPVSARQATYPVVLIAHGRHSALTFERDGLDFIRRAALPPNGVIVARSPMGYLIEFPSFEGHTYLAEHLASHGFMALSINLNGAFHNVRGRGDITQIDSGIAHRGLTILRHLDRLRQRDATDDVLAARIDLDQVALVGHSRGGEAVVSAHRINETLAVAERFALRAILSIAPTDFIRYDMALPYLVLIGSHDGDVSNLQGLRLYDRAARPKHLTWLAGAIHNHFNTNWKWQDEVPDDPDVRAPIVTRAHHEDTARAYTTALLRHYLRPRVGGLLGLLNGAPLPASLATLGLHFGYGAPASTRTLIDSFEDAPADRDHNSLGGNVTVADVAAYNEARLVNAALSDWFQDSSGLLVEWATDTARYTTELPSGAVAPSPLASLSVDLGHDPGVTPPGGDLDLKLVLRDTHGRAAEVLLSGLAALPRPLTKRIFDRSAPFPQPAVSMRMTFLKTVQIPLSRFLSDNRRLDLEHLAELTFLFSERSRGKLGIGHIEIVE